MNEMWHFIADNKLRDGSEPAPVGGVERWDGPVVLCARGLHACPRALDALKYAPIGAPSGTIQVRLVLLSGIVLADDDKAVASERHILASADCTRELHEFALWCAESVDWAAGWAAGWGAGWGAARAAVLAAARAAGLAAGLAAVWAAGWAAAWDVAWDAARAAQNAELERRLHEKLGGERRGR